MSKNSIVVTSELRTLLRAQRRQRARMTQAQAAKAAGISEIWWSQLETGVADTANLDTLAAMCYAVNVPLRALRKLGYDNIASEVELRIDWFGAPALTLGE